MLKRMAEEPFAAFVFKENELTVYYSGELETWLQDVLKLLERQVEDGETA